jgi:hypothetical protein
VCGCVGGGALVHHIGDTGLLSLTPGYALLSPGQEGMTALPSLTLPPLPKGIGRVGVRVGARGTCWYSKNTPSMIHHQTALWSVEVDG